MAVISGTNTVQIPANQRFAGLVIYGNCIQDGTPTPDNPVEIQRVTTLAVQLDGVTQFEVDLQGHDMCKLASRGSTAGQWRDSLAIDEGGHAQLEKRTVSETYTGGFKYYGPYSYRIAGKYKTSMLHYIDHPKYDLHPASNASLGFVTPMSDRYVGYESEADEAGIRTQMAARTRRFYLYDSRFSSATDMNAFAAENPIDVVLPLASQSFHTIDLGGIPALDLHAAHTLTVVADVDVEIELTTADFAGGVVHE